MQLSAKQRTAIYAFGAAAIGLARAFNLITDGDAAQWQETLASTLEQVSAILVAVTALVHRPTKTEPALVAAVREDTLIAAGMVTPGES